VSAALRGENNGAANNGMHPTRDTPAVSYLESGWRAGDAGRYVADLLTCSLEGTREKNEKVTRRRGDIVGGEFRCICDPSPV